MASEQDKPTLCLDFDGVLHHYRNGWQGATVIDDTPVPGAQEFVQAAQEHFRVVVYSSRSNYPGGIEAMKQWMRRYDFPEVEFVTEKPLAMVIIDDRAVLFSGMWPDVSELLEFEPWYRRGSST